MKTCDMVRMSLVLVKVEEKKFLGAGTGRPALAERSLTRHAMKSLGEAGWHDLCMGAEVSILLILLPILKNMNTTMIIMKIMTM